jgi:hypothetical protein
MLTRPARLAVTAAAVPPPAAARAASRSGVLSVTVMPGCTTVTSIPDGPSSSARILVRAATATLRIEPAGAVPALRAARPLMLMIRPQPWAVMCGATARAQRR